jgi:acid phosphatase
VNNIAYETPEGCTVDMASITSRHGSRHPDPAVWKQWVALQLKIKNSAAAAQGALSFISTWKPVVQIPDQELTQLSAGGYKELYDMGVSYRWRYPNLYSSNKPFLLWANAFFPTSPRVIDSARLFARGFMGPNATTLGTVYVLNNTDPRALGNSLAVSDLCPAYNDTMGGPAATAWANIYLPPIVTRINALTTPKGAVNFNTTDISLFPLLCGFESEITGKRSPWCDVLTMEELQAYEYSQDLRFYYGHGPGSLKNSTFMLPFLSALMSRFLDGPNQTYTSSDGTRFIPPPFIVTFTNDAQVNQLVSQIGVFDDQQPLPSNKIPGNQRYIASHFDTMRGTIGFERLTCTGNLKRNQQSGQFIRIILNDVVYPVVGCDSGPGRSCQLEKYVEIITQKQKEAGGFVQTCFGANQTAANIGLAAAGITGTPNTTFLSDLALPFAFAVKP